MYICQSLHVIASFLKLEALYLYFYPIAPGTGRCSAYTYWTYIVSMNVFNSFCSYQRPWWANRVHWGVSRVDAECQNTSRGWAHPASWVHQSCPWVWKNEVIVQAPGVGLGAAGAGSWVHLRWASHQGEGYIHTCNQGRMAGRHLCLSPIAGEIHRCPRTFLSKPE